MHKQKNPGVKGKYSSKRPCHAPAQVLSETVSKALGLDVESTNNRLLNRAIDSFDPDIAGPEADFLLRKGMQITDLEKVGKERANAALSRFPQMVRESIEPSPPTLAARILSVFIDFAKRTVETEFKICVLKNAWELVPHLMPKEMSEIKEELVRIQAVMERELGKEFPEITEAAKEAEKREKPSVSIVKNLEELKEEERKRVISEEVERIIEPAGEPGVEVLDDHDLHEVKPPPIPPEKKARPPRKEVTEIQVRVYEEGSISVPVDDMIELGDDYQLKCVIRREEPPYNFGFDLFFEGDYVGYILVIENASQTFFLRNRKVTIHNNEEGISVEIKQPGIPRSSAEFESIRQSIDSFIQDPDSHNHLSDVREGFERIKEDKPLFDSTVEMVCHYLLASDDHYALEKIASEIHFHPGEPFRGAREAIVLSAKLPVEQHRWTVFNDELSAFEQCKERADAEKYFENALEILEQRKGDSGLFPATLEKIQATIIRTQNKDEAAEKALRKAIELALMYKEESPDWGHMMADKAANYLFDHVKDPGTRTWTKQMMIQLVEATMWINKAELIERIGRMRGQEAVPDTKAKVTAPPPIPSQRARPPPLPASVAEAPGEQEVIEVEEGEPPARVKYETSEQTIKVLIEDAEGWAIPEICLDLGENLQLRYYGRVQAEDETGSLFLDANGDPREARMFDLLFLSEHTNRRLFVFSGCCVSFDWGVGGVKITLQDKEEIGVLVEINGPADRIEQLKEQLPTEYPVIQIDQKEAAVFRQIDIQAQEEVPAPEIDVREEVSEPIIKVGADGIEVPDEISKVAPLPKRPPSVTQELSGSDLRRVLKEEIDLDKPAEALALKVKENAGLILYGKELGTSSEILWKTDGMEKMADALLQRSALPDPPYGSELLAYNISDKLGLIRYDTWVDQTDSFGRQIKMSYVVMTGLELGKEVIDYIIKNPSDAFALFNRIFSDGLSEQGFVYTADSSNARKGELLILNRDELSDTDREHLRYNWEQHFGEQMINYSTVAPVEQLGIVDQFAQALKRGDMENAIALKTEIKSRSMPPNVTIATDIEGERTQLTPSCAIKYGGQETRKLVAYKKLTVEHSSGNQSFELNRYQKSKDFVTDEGVLIRITAKLSFRVEAKVLEIPEPSEAEKIDGYAEKTYIIGEGQGNQTAVPLGRGYRLEWGGRIHDEETGEIESGMRRFRIQREGTRKTRLGQIDDVRYKRDFRMMPGEEKTFELEGGLLRVTIVNNTESADVKVEEATQEKEQEGIVDSLLFVLINDPLKEKIGRDETGHEVSGVYLLPEENQQDSIAEILDGMLQGKFEGEYAFDLDEKNTAKVKGFIPPGEIRWGIPKENIHLTGLTPIGEVKIMGKDYCIFDQEVGSDIEGRITLKTGLKPCEELRGSMNSDKSIVEALSGVRPEEED